MKHVIIGLLAIGLMVATFAGMTEAAETPQPEIMVVDNPFRVDGDVALAVEADSGSGVLGDPYIIENREIDAFGYDYGIYVGNTTSYLVIRNCTVNQTSEAANHPYYVSAGIHIFNSDVVNITNCTIFDCMTYGIFLSNSSEFINVIDSTIWNCSDRGVAISDTDNCEYTGNTISGNETTIIGMSFDLLSDGQNINNNTIQDILVIGIGFNDSWYFQMADNTISGFLNESGPDDVIGPVFGVIFYNSNYTTMIDNTIEDCYIGLNVTASSYMGNYSGNTFDGNLEYGVALDNCTYQTFWNNTFTDNDIHAYDPESKGTWNSTTHGNSWDDYTGYDADGDGIGETEYILITGYDYFPLTTNTLAPSGVGGAPTPSTTPPVADTTTTPTDTGWDIELGWMFWLGGIMLLLGFAHIPIPYVQPLWLKVGGVFLIILNFLL